MGSSGGTYFLYSVQVEVIGEGISVAGLRLFKLTLFSYK